MPLKTVLSQQCLSFLHNCKKKMIALVLILLLIHFGTNLLVYKQTLLHYLSSNPSSGQWSAIVSSNSSTRELCPLIPPKLLGRLQVSAESPKFDKMEELYSWVERGGRHKPKECLSRNTVAIIVPYRDRERNMRTFLYNIHPILERQQLDYGVYIVEQNGDEKFNKGRIINAAFLEALKHYDYQCFIFHDVDLIPDDDRILYTCPEKDRPRHIGVAVEQFGYRLPYEEFFGCVTAFTTEQFKRINGFSNEFWGWGGEDDDLYNRVRYYEYNIERYPGEIARYKSLKHKISFPEENRFVKLYSGQKRYKTDGINNVKYRVVDRVYKKLYTWLLVDVGSP